ncbi:MAG: YbfB/YjiJ family MFS transporter [Alphaproteobacteria bacterium]|nr:YbfB/YjiJ family MFS transporter [Alphaproteobacteria bacterium]
MAMTATARADGVARATFAGLCAILVGIGLARFAYTPLIPALIAAGWFGPADAFYLGAANFAGYLAGALTARAMARHAAIPTVLRAMMLLVAASFFAGMSPISFAWFFLWRFASGLAGGVLMVLGPTAVLAQIPAARRGFAGGVIFAGVGIGIIASGTAVPLLMRLGLAETWAGIGIISVLLTVAAWRFWPEGDAPIAATNARAVEPGATSLKVFCLVYGLTAIGLVPHMVFLVDFVARGVGAGLEIGARYWVLFGIGAMIGPVLAGQLADRIGFGRALRLALLAEAFAVILPVVTDATPALNVTSLVVGGFVPGVAGLAVGRVHELVNAGDAERRAAWSLCTVFFAIGQALGAYAMSAAFAAFHSYALLFAAGAAVLALSLMLDTAVRAPAQHRGP